MKFFWFAPLLIGALALNVRPPRATTAGGVQIVGPSVLMNARAHKDAAIFDLRAHGRRVPDAQAPSALNKNERRAVFLLGETKVCARFAKQHELKDVFIVTPRSVEFEPLIGVPQLSPRQAREKVEGAGWPLLDVSESEEFAGSHLPFSRRLNFVGFENSPQLPRNRPFIVACRVGHRSQLVVQRLRKLGFDAHNLNGGLWAWECAGLPLWSGR